jgi:pimeloyl-ACP methyl ester carboxylesterase
MSTRFACALLCLSLIAGAGRAEDAPKEIVLGDCLVIRPVGRGGRVPIHLDAIEAEIVAGKWKAPKAGDTVALPDGGERRWEEAKAKDGVVTHQALGGGYLYWPVTSDAARVMILEASGHLLCYVNGEPRTGDPYQNGIVRLPVALKKGTNDLLFLCPRGALRAKLVAPAAPVLIDTRDATLPDVLPDDKEPLPGAVVVVNATDKEQRGLSLTSRAPDGEAVTTAVPPLPPCSTRKVPFTIPTKMPRDGNQATIELTLSEEKTELDQAKVNVRLRKEGQSYRRTFVSGIDGSVQYYAVQPGELVKDGDKKPALFLTLHGASVEAMGQADAYSRQTWGHVVAPTNRRPYGFDWEDWGRLDALEVLEIAKRTLDTDPRRTYLTGHSMGGHGTWHVGLTFPDKWAAIAPSAGWISFATYGGAPRPENPTPMQAMLLRAASPSETLTLLPNSKQYGVYVLHGDADDNVPVGQAREMRKQLAAFHGDFAYYERPGAGHWWGNQCVDWPPLFDFLNRHSLPLAKDVRAVEFVTASPGVSADCHWLRVEAQVHTMKRSTVKLRYDDKGRSFKGTTDNVARLSLDLSNIKPDEPLAVEIDGKKFEKIEWPKGGRLWLVRDGDSWAVAVEPKPDVKGPRRCGPFKEVFKDRMVFVYGTRGSTEENAWALAKARYDAETFWYRGNGSVEVIADTTFDAAKEPDRNVILYGHADGNAAWAKLLGDGPVQVKRGSVTVGERKESSDDLACLFVRPRPGSRTALVGVVSGTGLAGMRLTDRMPYFVSGVGFPDCLVVGAETLTKGYDGVRAAGFFGNDWGFKTGEFIWRDGK